MIYIIFLLSASFTIFLSVKISKNVDIIDKKSSINAVFLGILLGGATSLPEITTSVTSIIIDNPDLAVGNVLGSNLFNIMILAFMDLLFRKRRLFDHSTNENLYSVFLFLLLSSTIALSIILTIPYSFFGIGLETILLILLYIIGMKIISKITNKKSESVDDSVDELTLEKYKNVTLKQASVRFIVCAIFIMVSGTLLTIFGDKIAIITGLGASFVGSFLIAASTSLPEAIAVFVSIKLKNYKLAIGSILGSNLFNIMILIGTDVVYSKSAILQTSSPTHAITTLCAMSLGFICLYSLFRKDSKNAFTYALPSILVVVCYFISSYIIFLNS